MSQKDWIRVENGFSAVFCERCGDRYAISLPCSFNMMESILKTYGKSHGKCKPKGENNGTTNANSTGST